MIKITNLNSYYGKSHILQGVNLNVHEGEIVSLLGRNGVGRSTFIKSIMGMVKAEGSILFNNKEPYPYFLYFWSINILLIVVKSFDIEIVDVPILKLFLNNLIFVVLKFRFLYIKYIIKKYYKKIKK